MRVPAIDQRPTVLHHPAPGILIIGEAHRDHAAILVNVPLLAGHDALIDLVQGERRLQVTT
jgi:hypothetical protein